MLAKAYQKYLYIPRPVSKRYPMDVQHRAKQFAPFAALRGFEEIVRKQEILYEQRKVLSEEQKCGLDRKLQMVCARCQMYIIRHLWFYDLYSPVLPKAPLSLASPRSRTKSAIRTGVITSCPTRVSLRSIWDSEPTLLMMA